jgi:hypothetical protein
LARSILKGRYLSCVALDIRLPRARTINWCHGAISSGSGHARLRKPKESGGPGRIESSSCRPKVRRCGWQTSGFSRCFTVDSRVPRSPLNPEGETPMFCVSSGVTANFVMVPKFEESAKKSTRGWQNGWCWRVPPETRVNKRLLTTKNSALSRVEQRQVYSIYNLIASRPMPTEAPCPT